MYAADMLKSPVALKTPQNTLYLVYRTKKQDDQPLACVEQSELQPAFVVGEDCMPSDDQVPASTGELVLEPAPVVDGDRMPTDDQVPASTEESTLEPAAVVEEDEMPTDDQVPISTEQSTLEPVAVVEEDGMPTVPASTGLVEIEDDGSIIISAEALASLDIRECMDIDIVGNDVVLTVRQRTSVADNYVDQSPQDSESCEGNHTDQNPEDNESFEEDHIDQNPSDSSESGEEDDIEPVHDERESVQRGSRWKRAVPSSWKKNIHKKMRRDAKMPKKACHSCRFRCTEHFSEGDRIQLCKEFHSITSYEQQKNFILANTVAGHIERQRVRSDEMSRMKKRDLAVKYFFWKDNVQVRVRKIFFTSTLCIGHSPVTEAIRGSGPSGTFVGVDRRGKHPPGTKTKKDDLDLVRAHINKFPRTPSHYTRCRSKREYLDPKLSIQKMYELYLEDMAQNHSEKKPVKSAIYRRIFCTEYNLSFFKPKKDQCQLCSRYSLLVDGEKENMKGKYDAHITRKTESQSAKAADKTMAAEDHTKVVITFDLQSVLQIPSSDVSPLYYSRKLCMYNLTVHNAVQPHQAFCYCWTEIDGKRGSCEIGTCLYKYIKQLPPEVTEVTLYSDTCGGQNRNQHVVAMLLYAVQTTHISVIHQKFLESGHSEMEVDSMHASIERTKKFTPVYTALDWHTIFRSARRINPYVVVPLTTKTSMISSC